MQRACEEQCCKAAITVILPFSDEEESVNYQKEDDMKEDAVSFQI